MARTAQASANGKQARKAPKRRKKSRSLLTNVAVGLGLTMVALVGASVATMATAVKSTADVKFEIALAKPIAPAVAPAAPAAREIDVSKFSRLSDGSPASPKSRRLDGADVAALEARKPDRSSARQMLGALLAKANRHAESERQFAALANRRPGAEANRAALAPAMESLVVVAPRGDEVMPDLIQDAAPATSVAQLKDMKPVEMAALEETAVEDNADALEEAAVEATDEPAPAEAHALPKAGPLPVIRPSSAFPGRPAKPSALAAIAAVAPQKPAQPAEDDKPTALAFAKPDNPLRDTPARPGPAPKWPGIGTKVAIYDISNAVVHMPNGTKLEAHSGIGSMRDNPKFTHVKMRGPTPPGTYKLSMREKLFHGVAAIRLTSVDGRHPQNRTGLLAHSFLLRVRGDSHGCVAFADYDRFLKAFQRGEITHMVIVPKWDGKRPGSGGGGDNFIAKLFSGSDA